MRSLSSWRILGHFVRETFEGCLRDVQISGSAELHFLAQLLDISATNIPQHSTTETTAKPNHRNLYDQEKIMQIMIPRHQTYVENSTHLNTTQSAKISQSYINLCFIRGDSISYWPSKCCQEWYRTTQPVSLLKPKWLLCDLLIGGFSSANVATLVT